MRFSIVIPTCDRPGLLATSLPACLLTDRRDVEVIVSDNFSGPETGAVIDRFRGDPRLRSVRASRRLPMADHWEFAWQHAQGDLVIINSDDDFFSPRLLTGIDAVCGHTAVGLGSWDAGLYLHPDWDLAGPNTFHFEAGHSGLACEIDPWRLAEAYARLDIPKVFPQGTRICFSKELGERVRKRVGRLFWTPFPDFSAPLLMLALLEGNERYVYFDSLLGYGGRSRNSNAAATIPKERGRAGNTARVREFVEEHSGENLFGDLEFQGMGLTNGHAQTLALLRRLLPAKFDRIELDLVAYIAGIEGEFRGINVNNPWMGPEDRERFDRFLARQDRKSVEQALQLVEQRWINYRMAQWRKDWRRVPISVFPHALKPNVFGDLLKRALQIVLNRLAHPARSESGTGARSGVRADVSGALVTVHCDSFGGRNGLDLAQKFDDVVESFDHRSERNLVEFRAKGELIAAYAPENGAPQATHQAGESKQPAVRQTANRLSTLPPRS